VLGELVEESSLAETSLLLYCGLDSEFNHHKLSMASLRGSLHRNVGSIRHIVMVPLVPDRTGPGAVKAGPDRTSKKSGPSPVLPSTRLK